MCPRLRPTYGPDEDRNLTFPGHLIVTMRVLRPTYGPDEDRNERDVAITNHSEIWELRPTYGPDEDRNTVNDLLYIDPHDELRPTYGPDEDRNGRPLYSLADVLARCVRPTGRTRIATPGTEVSQDFEGGLRPTYGPDEDRNEVASVMQGAYGERCVRPTGRTRIATLRVNLRSASQPPAAASDLRAGRGSQR